MKHSSPMPAHPKGLYLLPTELITHWFSCPCSLSISRKTEKSPLCNSVCGTCNKLWSWDHTGEMITGWPGKLCSLNIFDRLIPTSPAFSHWRACSHLLAVLVGTDHVHFFLSEKRWLKISVLFCLKTVWRHLLFCKWNLKNDVQFTDCCQSAEC